MPAITPKTSISLLKETFNEWSEDNAPRLGAALAYYTIFSLAPLLVIVIAVTGLVWGNQSGEVRAEVTAQIEALMGAGGADMVRTVLDNMGREESKGVLASVLGVAALIFGATTLFAQLKNSLNDIWGVRPDPERGWLNMVTARVMSFGLILTVGFLLLVSLVISAVLSALGDLVTGLAPGTEFLLRAIGLLVSFGLVTLLFAMIYHYLPDAKVTWRDTWIGAAITALLFTIGKFALGVYLAGSAAESTYGAAGSLVLLLLWVYYSAQILFFGAEFTKVYARRYGSGVQPSKRGVLIDPDEASSDEATSDAPSPEKVAPARALAASAARGHGGAARLKRFVSSAAGPMLIAFLIGRAWGRRGS